MVTLVTAQSVGGIHLIEAEESVSVAQAGTTEILHLMVRGIKVLFIQVTATGQALDAFTIQSKCHPNAPFVTDYSIATDYTSPAGIMIGSDESDLTTLAAGASGWVRLEVSGTYEVKVIASSANIAGSTVTVYAGGS